MTKIANTTTGALKLKTWRRMPLVAASRCLHRVSMMIASMLQSAAGGTADAQRPCDSDALRASHIATGSDYAGASLGPRRFQQAPSSDGQQAQHRTAGCTSVRVHDPDRHVHVVNGEYCYNASYSPKPRRP
jgi:hypothetical protein